MHHMNCYQQDKGHATRTVDSRPSYIALLVMAALLAVSSPVIAMPDLTIESISGVQSTYNVGEAMPIFKVRVKNIGDAPIPKLKVISVELKSCTFVWKGHASNCKSEFMAGAESSTSYIYGLTAGSVVDIRWPVLWPGTPTHTFKEGDYELVFKVYGLSEASYGNNEYTLNISAAYPGVDSFVLTMQGIDYVGPCPKGNIDIAKGSIFVTHGSGYIDYKYVTSMSGESPHTYSKAVNNKETITTGIKSVAQYDMDGWIAVKVTSPYEQTSEKGYFKIRCTDSNSKKNIKVIPKQNLKVLPKKKIMLK